MRAENVMMLVQFVQVVPHYSPLARDGGHQGPGLVVVDAGVAGRPGEALHLVRDTGPPGTRLRPVGPDGESAGRGPLGLLQPARVPPVVRPQLVKSVPVLRQLSLYRHGVPQGGVRLVHGLHLHQAVPGRSLLRDLGRQLVNL